MFTQHYTGHFALMVLLCIGISPCAVAQSSSDQFWPEIDTYYSFNPKLRLLVVASRSTDGASYDSIEVGPTLNFFAKRFVKPVLSTSKEEKNNLLQFGVGYRYLAGLDQVPENRVEFDVTPHIPLPGGFLVGDRSRIDLRFMEDNSSSWRYRNRINLQRTFKIRRVALSPYAQAEFFYYSNPGSWNKRAVQFGADFPLRKHFDFEFYYERDNNVGSAPNQVNAVGLTASIYF